MTRRGVLAGAAACAAGLPRPGLAQGSAPLKIGVLLPTTGGIAAAGQASRRGIDLAAEMINAAAGAGGRRVEILHFDTESKPENGRIGAEKLVRDGATLLIGAWESGATMAAAQVAEQSKVPLIVNIASAPQITEQGYGHVFRNFPLGPGLVRNAVERIKDLLAQADAKPRSAVLLHVNDTFGQGILRSIEALWPQLQVPLEIVSTIAYDPAARDLSIEVAKAKSLKPDVVLPVTRVNDAILIVREMVKQRFSPMGLIGPGSAGPFERAFTDALGKYGDFYLTSVPWFDTRRPRAKAMLAAFAAKHPRERAELNVGFSFEAVEIAADAARRAGSIDPAALREAVAATDLADHVMVGGPIRFDAKGQNTGIGGVMLQNRDGQPRIVGPADVAETKAVFPVPTWESRA